MIHLRTYRSLLSTLCALALATQVNAAVSYHADYSSPRSATGVGNFTVGGGAMAGMAVTIHYSDGFSESATWHSFGPMGGATGGAFAFAHFGSDTFVDSWLLSSYSLSGTITGFDLDGGDAFAFDRTSDDQFVSSGSARGRDFDVDGPLNFDIVVTYSDPISLGGAAASGDLFGRMAVRFDGGLAAGQNLEFFQDTDALGLALLSNGENLALEGQAVMPEPATALAALMGGVMLMRRRSLRRA